MHNFQMQQIWFPESLTKYLGLFRIAIDVAIYKNRTLNRFKSVYQFYPDNNCIRDIHFVTNRPN